MEIKTEINKWDLFKLKRFCIAKENYKQDEKTTLRMGEKNKVNETSDKGLISKIYKQSYNSMPEKQTTQSKSGVKTKTDFSPKKTYRWLTNT